MSCPNSLINQAQTAAEWYYKLSRAYASGVSPGTPPPFIIDPNDYKDGDSPGNAEYWSTLGIATMSTLASEAAISANASAVSASQSEAYAELAAASAASVVIPPAYDGDSLFIQDETPTSNSPYLWIQTNVNTDGDFSFWINN